MRQRLPFPGGLRKGEDAKQGQAESNSLRRSLIKEQTGWVISPFGENVWTTTSSSVLTANTLFFFWLPRREAKVIVESAAIYVETLSASQTLKTALYRYVVDSKQKRFVKVAGSDALFSTSSTGRVSFTLPALLEISPEAELFLGCLASSSTPAYRSGAGNRPIRALNVAGTALPSVQPLTYLSRVDIAAPLVTYLSTEATDLL
jgi:hypothetical protein